MKNKINFWFFAVVGLVGMAVTGCEDDPIPVAIRENTSAYAGEWVGQDAVTVTNNGVSTTAILPEILSLRTEAGKDTFNIINAATGAIIVERSGTWSVVRVEGQDGEGTNNILRLGVRTAGRVTYSVFAIKEVTGNSLVLLDGYTNNSRNLITLRYTK
jgi:hypothetical protein